MTALQVKLRLQNTIIWENDAPEAHAGLCRPQLRSQLTHSVLEGGLVEGMEDLGGNLTADPLFASAPKDAPSATVDLRLLNGSPALNSGDASLLPPDSLDLDRDGDLAEPLPVDLQGQARVQGETVDIGAYEGALTNPSPSSPAALEAAAQGQRITLSWMAVAENDLAGYHVYRSDVPFDALTEATRLTATPLTDTTYTDEDVAEAQPYHYRVTAVDVADNESEASSEASAATADQTPQAHPLASPLRPGRVGRAALER